MRTTTWLTATALLFGLLFTSVVPAQEKKTAEPKKAAEPKAVAPKPKVVEPKAPGKKTPPERMPPTVANYEYGKDSERQKFDFFQAKSDKPTPVVLLIHGGGWKNGDKTGYGTTAIKPFLDAGISVACINYRFIDQAMEQKVVPPVKASLHDAARALQTIRSKAKEWNIDPTKVGANGGSAGACTSLWLALHDDLADPKSSDPIARESSKLQCAAVNGAQTSLDPKELREWMPNAIYGGHAFGFAAPGRDRAAEFDLLMAKRDEVMPWIKEYSPIELVDKNDPPLYLDYSGKNPPVLGESPPDPTHSPIYGVKLAERCKPLGVECIVTYKTAENKEYGSTTKFLISKLMGK